MAYGLKIHDTSGNSSLLTPNIHKIVSAGELTMSNSLNGDNTYGTDIDLPGATGIPVGNLGVLVYPVIFHFYAKVWWWRIWMPASLPWLPGFYADDSETHYTKNSSTGVMTSWTPGNMTNGQINTWDPIVSIFPLTGWDTPGNPSTVTVVRIWAAMAYIVYDTSASTGRAVYTIGNKGVEKVNYMIFLKNY